MGLETKVDHLKVIVFDLDYTLWPFWVDTHVDPPFQKKGDKVYDRNNQHVTYYKEVPAVLEKLISLGYELGIASRTGAIEEAEDLLRLFNWNQYFSYKQIYPGTKTTHIKRISKDSGVKLSEILFFDDESRNIRDLTAINVCSILVHSGVTMEVVRKGIQTFVNSS
ncbi:PREDICTED: magnesium-dependent phosphatase 1-like [Rhagoletis zephyria]|uniref:magnesium-dependent phosphatase 1-like n=1 Tax=Rhagoletis zephyria TaxID=28612 RepID=UPI000811896A|nr:PREDICTED: magnesium-dependent phosphatase 1-like [Rhagoletis zephyria]